MLAFTRFATWVEEGFRENDILTAVLEQCKIVEDYPDESRCLVLGHFLLTQKCGEVYFEPGGADKLAAAVECLFDLAIVENQHRGHVSASVT